MSHSLTNQQHKLLAAAEAIRLDPDKAEAAYLARQLIQATLPHKDPGNVPLWSRQNGHLTLTIQPGRDKQKLLGYPYGTIPRLLLFWITTEALRTNNRRLELGRNLDIFMQQLRVPARLARKYTLSTHEAQFKIAVPATVQVILDPGPQNSDRKGS